jgi:hypothetical protein
MKRRASIAKAGDVIVSSWTAAAGIVVIAAVLWLTQRRIAAAPMEEGFMLDLPLRVLHGAVPEKSFEFLYGPLALWIPAVIYAVFGATLAVERAVGAAYVAVLATAFYLLGARSSRVVGAVGALIALLLGQYVGDIGHLSALPLTGALAFGALGVAVAGSPRDGIQFDLGAGVLLGLAADLRPEYAVFGVVAVATLALLGVRGRLVVLAFIAALVPYLVVVALAGFENVWQALVVTALHLPGERLLPLSTEGHWAITALVACAGEICVAIYIGWNRDRSPETATVILLALLMALATSDFIQRADGQHLETFVAILAPVGVLLGNHAYELGGRRLTPPTAVAVVVAIVALVTAGRIGETAARSSMGAFVEGTTESYPVRNDGRSWLYSSASGARDAARIVLAADKIADSTRGASLFVGTADLSQTPYVDNSFYFLLPHFIQRSHYYDFHPGIALRDGSGLADSVGSASVLILTRIVFDEPNLSSRHGSQAANDVVRTNYRLLVKAGSYFLYERR